MDTIAPLPIYAYSPLSSPDSIRILVLHPSEDHLAPLLCDLIHDDRHRILVSLEQGRGYEAVSYTWGDPVFSHEILCNYGATKLAITPNVDSLLRHLRKKTNVRRLWVDAICLSQKNHDEKRIQVCLMGEIYRQARKVHIWLGDGLGFTKESRRTIQQTDRNDLSRFMAFFRVLSLERQSKGRTVSVRHIASKFYPTDEELLEQTHMFLHSPWFQRRWTIQEAALNNHTVVRFGSSKIPWEEMSNSLEILQTNHDLSLDDFALTSLETALAIRSRRGTVLQLLYKHHRAQCFDPRDRIAALLSVATNETSHVYAGSKFTDTLVQWTVDYDISWAENYGLFAQSAIINGHVVELLEHLWAFGPLSQEDCSRPSWVPNWSCTRPYSYRARRMEQTYRKDRVVEIGTANGLCALTLLVTNTATIEHVANSPGDFSIKKLEELWMQLRNMFGDNKLDSLSARRKALSDLLRQAIWSPLSTYCESSIQKSESIAKYMVSPRMESGLRHDLEAWLLRGSNVDGLRHDFVGILQDLLQSHTVFANSEGIGTNCTIFGLASCDMQKGDVVGCFDIDSSVSYMENNNLNFRGIVLRRWQPNEERQSKEYTRCFRVIGNCYVLETGNAQREEYFTLV